jgi:hypothetical protein
MTRRVGERVGEPSSPSGGTGTYETQPSRVTPADRSGVQKYVPTLGKVKGGDHNLGSPNGKGRGLALIGIRLALVGITGFRAEKTGPCQGKPFCDNIEYPRKYRQSYAQGIPKPDNMWIRIGFTVEPSEGMTRDEGDHQLATGLVHHVKLD